MADNSKKLSFSSVFNQQKILLNDSRTVNIPSSIGPYTTVVSFSTGLTYVPVFRCFVQFNSILYPITQQFAVVDDIIAGVDSSFNFFIKAVSIGVAVNNVTFYWRIYTDSKPA